MPRYISLLKFTEQGARAINKSTTRAHDFNTAAYQARLLPWLQSHLRKPPG